jgi:hypothetical protein
LHFALTGLAGKSRRFPCSTRGDAVPQAAVGGSSRPALRAALTTNPTGPGRSADRLMLTLPARRSMPWPIRKIKISIYATAQCLASRRSEQQARTSRTPNNPHLPAHRRSIAASPQHHGCLVARLRRSERGDPRPDALRRSDRERRRGRAERQELLRRDRGDGVADGAGFPSLHRCRA